MNVSELREHLNLSSELVGTLLRLKVQALDCDGHGFLINNLTLIYVAKATFSYNQIFMEVVGCNFDVGK